MTFRQEVIAASLVGLFLAASIWTTAVIAVILHGRATSEPSQAGSAAAPLSRRAPATLRGGDGANSDKPAPDFDDFCAAVAAVESNDDDSAVGDNGASRGRYQIGRAYWQDACEFGGEHLDYSSGVTNPSKCEQVMEWYFQRYAPQAWESGDWFTMARIHNGGPRGDEKRCTIAYAERVLTAMKGAN